MIDDGRSQTVSDALLRQVLIILERIEKQEALARLGLSDNDDDPLSRQAKELSAMGEISLSAQEMIYNHARPVNKVKRDDLRNPYWINEKVLRDGKIRWVYMEMVRMALRAGRLSLKPGLIGWASSVAWS